MEENAPGSATRPSLLRRICDAGDTDAWRTFVDVYGPLIYRHARRKGLQDADAAEVTQEVLLQVSRSIQKFEYRPEQARFRDWLGIVTENKIRSFLRHQAVSIRAQGEGTTGEPWAGVAAEQQDTQWTEAFNDHLLQTALTRTRPQFVEPIWRAFELVWRDQRSVSQVAEELGQSMNWVYLAKSRVLKRLRAEVQELAEDIPLWLA
ncbi:MAG: sigma-70 family RNA polymerase sigma factor [Acidobacteria bacterium]|nr:sigma-70 family RNA polymerase sigma factor [Acidobacteriota bacterium]